MSRRKQARPIRLLEDGLAPPPPAHNTGESSGSGSEDEAGSSGGNMETASATCQRCQSEFLNYGEFVQHSKECSLRNSSPQFGESEEIQEDDYDRMEGVKRQEEARRQRQDAENNNSVEEGETEEGETGEMPVGFPFPLAGGHVTLEALQNTKVAVAQFAATAMANNADNTAALQELAVLQSTLYTLQHQQMMQLNLIQQLQQQLQITRPKEGSPSSPPPPCLPPTLQLDPPAPLPKPSRTPTPVKQEVPLTPPASQSIAATNSVAPAPPKSEPSPPVPPVSLPPCSISSAFASSIITNLDPPPSPSEPNTLEMLQRRAQEVLDNASQGLLANNLADELAFRKNGGKNPLSPYDSKTGGRNEPFFKHRCRYCGKVFGSDSALQIHIRSHTGERPFKCNVCGSRFTTKGNLKVHFQRHTSKFPHIKMNPNPVPEHLDKYHPPLLAQMGAHQSLPPGVGSHHPGGPPPPHHSQFPPSPQFPAGIPVYRPPPPPPHDLVLPPHARTPDPANKPILPLAMFGPRLEQEVPENLSKAVSSAHSSPLPSDQGDFKREHDEEPRDLSEPRENIGSELHSRLSPKREMEMEGDSEQDPERYPSPPPYDDCSLDSKYTGEDVPGDRDSPGVDKNDDSLQDQPENLSNKSTSDIGHFSLTPDHRLPPSLHFPNIISPPSSSSSGSVHRLTPRGFVSTPETDPVKDPAIYSSLLPRPGSNDNSWESLIEVTKTSETSKLQQLVDNIEHKLTDPNQCVICQRVLSCKSALQMHYRTHTGERPFRCRICGRAFTTKGNLKTHMGVHRIKPPMRTLHQCPVCHKKFTNGLVLQQHIRLHTGEPTDLTPEQIQAAEIRDFIPQIPSSSSSDDHSRPFMFHPFPPNFLSRDAPSNPGLQPHQENSCESSDTVKRFEEKSDYLEDSRPNSISPIPDAVFSSSLSALENQVRTITTISSQHSSSPSQKVLNHSPEDLCNNREFTPITVNGEKSPGSRSPSGSEGQLTPSPLQPSSLVMSRSGQPGSPAESSLGALDLTPRGPAAPPIFPPGFGLLPPGSTPLITTALSSLTSSVLTSTAFNPLGLSVGPAGRGNTTCNLCFKTFACNSALEIHYRSHTKERPFKCTICERGFSTKGNMKQHMLTHKIRDMPPHLFEQKSNPGSSGPQTPENSQDTSSGGGPPIQLGGGNPEPRPPPPSPPKLELGVKRSPPQTDLPLPKRQPSLPKHLCNVCNKNFSSSSALQIHMRTHTGDKPFRCTICHKAFTTKGNLKVHMGTHMWTNGASRRGRRMSLDLPPLPKDSEFLHRRPDLFYPYLPAPFLNGMHQKLNEMSVNQGGGHNGMLGFGGGGSGGGLGELKGEAGDKPLWEMHYDRKASGPEDGSPPPTQVMPPPRGEGLAA